MEQMHVRIGEINVPVIVDSGEVWFPIKTIAEKVLLRSGKYGLVTKNNKFKLNIKKYVINFGNNSHIETNCISDNELRKMLSISHIGRLSVEQRKSQNMLHEYLGMKLLPVDKQDTEFYDQEWLNELDDYTRDVVILEMKIDIKWYRRCSNCNIPLPLTSIFYSPDTRADKGFMKVCKICSDKVEFFRHPDSDKNEVRKDGLEYYKAVQENDLLKVFEAYRVGDIKRLPEGYKNEETYLKMIKIHFDNGTIHKDNLTMTYLEELGLKIIGNYFTATDVYRYLFGDNFFMYAWKYPKYHFREKEIPLTNELAIQIIKNYIVENNVIIEDIFNYDYAQLFKKCKVNYLTSKDIQSSIVHFYDNEYAGYKFKQTAVNYYKNDDNVLFDLKYFIEKEMRLDVNKIPLYLTKTTLQRRCLPLYRWIITHKNGSVYEWVNRLYPNQFTETDFEINAYREEFGSDEEMWIHEILKEHFGNNVIYNQIHTCRTIEIDGKIPDWLVMTNSGVWIAEYFGLYVERQYGKSGRVTDYIDKTHRKIEEYSQISGYRYLYLYPDDVNDDYKGVRQKIANMKEI